MPLPVPDLDDRTFNDLVEECRRIVMRSCPEWTDLSPGDPGMVLLELFSHLTEVMIFRLNRVPEKAYIEFLRLLGVKLMPQAAAAVDLVFNLPEGKPASLVIPRGTRVTAERRDGEPPVFTTDETVTIPAGVTEVRVRARHGEFVDAELAGKSTGQPAQQFRVARGPVPDGTEFIVGVETTADVPERAAAREFDGRIFRIWRDTDHFANASEDDCLYLLDRAAGTLTFAPALLRMNEGVLEERPRTLAAVPPAGAEIRVWYRTGGGAEGNVSAGRLTVIKDPVPGVSVSNPAPARGGRNAETLENALLRGPQEFRSLDRAVTARDYELIALRHGSVARTRAFTRAEYWKHASPGTVEVALVPDIPVEDRPEGKVTFELLRERQSRGVLDEVRDQLAARSPLGTTSVVTWVQCKTVSVRARVVVHREEDPEAVRPRVLRRLHESISPMPPAPHRPGGWPFGKPLRASDIYDLILAEPGVSYVNQVRLLVDDAPDAAVGALIGDPFHARHWYASTGGTFFRTSNDASGWEKLSAFSDEVIRVIKPDSARAGRLALVTELSGAEKHCRVRISGDSGETWIREDIRLAFMVNDAAWVVRDGSDWLLLAADQGLFEINVTDEGSPIQVAVDAANPKLGFEAVTSTVSPRGDPCVAAAGLAKKGVFVSQTGGRGGSWAHIGLTENIRVLEIEEDGPRRFLWAGTWAVGDEPGKGCHRRELFTADDKWTAFADGWEAGTCHGIAFHPRGVFAATHRGGVLTLPSKAGGGLTGKWESPDVNCGLPIRDKPRFEKIECIAVHPLDTAQMLAGGSRGVFRRASSGRWVGVSAREFADEVTLPAMWLFCSGKHDINLTHENDSAAH